MTASDPAENTDTSTLGLGHHHARNFDAVAAALVVLAQAAPPRAAFADVDLAGEWAIRVHEDQVERGPGPEIGDFTGLPINEAARQRGMSWDASLLTVPEHQCGAHPANYGAMHSNIRIWKEVDDESQQVIAWHILHESWNRFRTVWMDGRPHPSPDELHSWQGFSTGRYVGNALEITTTHMKESRTRRNGIEHSDEAELVEILTRHDDYLTFISVLKDPHTLEEPYIHTRHFVLDTNQVIRPYPCRGAVEIDRPHRRRAAPSARRESVPRNVSDEPRHPGGSGARRRANDVSRVSATPAQADRRGEPLMGRRAASAALALLPIALLAAGAQARSCARRTSSTTFI